MEGKKIQIMKLIVRQFEENELGQLEMKCSFVSLQQVNVSILMWFLFGAKNQR
jgi:hypothetical protein